MAAGRLLATPAASDFDDLPAPFVASKARSEAEIDRIEALAHFAAGLQERGDLAQAIRHFAPIASDPAATAARNNLVLAAVVEKRAPPVGCARAIKESVPTRWATRPCMS